MATRFIRAESYDSAIVDELEELLCSVAAGVLTNRSAAIAYSHCRTALMDSGAKQLLPGFIYQCPTIFKFKDFITLYDPDPALREVFVRRTFERCRAMLESATQSDATAPAAPDHSDPQQWML